MNMVKSKPIYLSLKRKTKTAESTIDMCIKHPTLMQRLINLQDDKMNLDKKTENPWYEDMEKKQITSAMVEDAKDFINFCLAEDKKKYTIKEQEEE